VLSVNTSNLHHALTWREVTPHLQVVAIPDSPKDTASLRNTVDQLRQAGIAFRIDPILEPIGFGFAASLGRYLHCRQEYPDAEIMMGIGNLTELTDVDSAGLNVMLLGFCQELGIRSVLTTQVINWARTSVKELDLARRLVHFAVSQNALPKHREPRLVQLRDPRLTPLGEHALRELAEAITDPNYRIFAENGEIHIMNNQGYVRGTNPFTLFRQLQSLNPRLDPSHSFYLGYELAKAVTALTLHKQYTQDRALNWGILTLPEPEYREDDPHPPVTTE
jgi:dihydropteroate synthase-like protein